MKNSSDKKLKKKMLIAIIIAVCLIPISFGISYAIDLYTQNASIEDEEPIDYNWYKADYNENIFEDEDYMKLIEYGFISYTEGSVTMLIDRESAQNYGNDVAFMVEYLYSIIEGNTDNYNDKFSSEYYKRREPKESFTMQKIYDVFLNKELVTKIEDKKGSYTQYTFVLSYRIFENNGTFRKDIGDGSRRQYITFTDREGKLLIDNIATEKLKVQK